MKRLRQMVAVIVCVSVLLGGVNIKTQAAAPAINKTKATIKVGKKVKLKIKNTNQTVKWKSSNKKVATVSKKGVVKGKAAGKVTITATVGGKKYKCKVKVKSPKLSIKYSYLAGYEYSSTLKNVEVARFKVSNLTYTAKLKSNGKYDIYAMVTIQRTYDRDGAKAGSKFYIPMNLNFQNNTQLKGLKCEIIGLKKGQSMTVKRTFTDVSPGSYYLVTSGIAC